MVRPLSLLDLTSLDLVADEKGSVFDADYIHRLKRAEFLRGLSRRISKPVMPDNQPRDYLPTQAIADFLATAADPPLDGIIYPSVQAGPSHRIFGSSEDRRNVVLFHKAARVQQLEIPEGADVSVSDDGPWSLWHLNDGPETKYTVWEKVASTAPSPERMTKMTLRLSSPLWKSTTFVASGSILYRVRYSAIERSEGVGRSSLNRLMQLGPDQDTLRRMR